MQHQSVGHPGLLHHPKRHPRAGGHDQLHGHQRGRQRPVPLPRRGESVAMAARAVSSSEQRALGAPPHRKWSWVVSRQRRPGAWTCGDRFARPRFFETQRGQGCCCGTGLPGSSQICSRHTPWPVVGAPVDSRTPRAGGTHHGRASRREHGIAVLWCGPTVRCECIGPTKRGRPGLSARASRHRASANRAGPLPGACPTPSPCASTKRKIGNVPLGCEPTSSFRHVDRELKPAAANMAADGGWLFSCWHSAGPE